jgi:hypothetical protein
MGVLHKMGRYLYRGATEGKSEGYRSNYVRVVWTCGQADVGA